MDTEKDIKRILWHEIGHFLIDLIEETKLKNSIIDDLFISYHRDATSKHKWAGGVKTLPEVKFEIIVEDTEKTSFTLVSLISGCLFQTYFLKELEKEDVIFCYCFGFSESFAGFGDIHYFHKLINLIREKNGNNLKLQIFLEKELNEIFYKNLLRNRAFIKLTKKLVENYSKSIIEKFTTANNKDGFKYSFKEDNILNKLKDELSFIMNRSNFKLEILKLVENVNHQILGWKEFTPH